MEKYKLTDDINVMGFPVTTFPNGIGEAFDKLMNTIPDANDRPYYGIGECTPQGMVYIAAALQKYDGEAARYGYQKYKIEKGDYLAETVMDWPSKTACIKNVFEEMYKDDRSDRSKPSIEIYKDMYEMLCLVKINRTKELQQEFDAATNELAELLAGINEDEINKIPFEGSWTAGQLAKHVIMSDKGFDAMLHGPVKDTDRAPDEKVEKIKTDFLNFNIKMSSPEFVRPELTDYDKEKLLQSFKKIQASIDNAIQTRDLSKTCAAFEIPVLGPLTGLEAVNFVIYHTKRHAHQLKSIKQSLG